MVAAPIPNLASFSAAGLTQAEMAELFGVDRTRVVRYLSNIYKDGELDKSATCAENAQVQKEGKRTVVRKVPLYNLDAIISVGYRVNSKRGIAFRRWANTVLKQYLIEYKETIIEGGNHSNFGDYGFQRGDGVATLSKEEQINIARGAVVSFIKAT